jgi:hypothetical protein
MIAPVIIDMSEAFAALSISKEQMDDIKEQVLNETVDEFMYQWESHLKELHSSRAKYEEAMYVNKIDRFNIVAGLSPAYGKFPLMIEDGATAFDMKYGFSKSSKAHHTADGEWWLTIPFTHATESATSAETFSTQMPEAIHDLAKEEAESGSTKGLLRKDLPREFQKTKNTAGVSFRNKRIKRYTGVSIGERRIKAYEHKHPLYEGLVRKGKEHEEGYVTFRRVSSNSDDDAWIHTGIEAHNLMEKAMVGLEDAIETITQNALNNY